MFSPDGNADISTRLTRLRMTTNRRGTVLSIQQVGPDNVGRYECEVRTGTGESETVNAWLSISGSHFIIVK